MTSTVHVGGDWRSGDIDAVCHPLQEEIFDHNADDLLQFCARQLSVSRRPRVVVVEQVCGQRKEHIAFFTRVAGSTCGVPKLYWSSVNVQLLEPSMSTALGMGRRPCPRLSADAE